MIICIPGLGFDHTMFSHLKYPIITPKTHLANGMENEVENYVKNAPCHLLGFSLGGFIAAKIAAKYPVLSLNLIGIRRAYPEHVLHHFKKTIEKSRIAFYRLCFAKDKSWHSFKKTHLSYYLSHYKLQTWLHNIDWLSKETLRLHMPTTLVHGTCDQIAPIEEVRLMAEKSKHANLIEIQGEGHLLSKEQIKVR